MKRFEFPLEALLEKRKREEEAVKLELAGKNKEITAAQNELLDIEKELRGLQEEEKRKRKQVKDVLPLKMSVSYRNKLKLDILKKGEDIHTLQMQRGDIRKRLVKATQKKRALELLREARYQEWLKENKRLEQVFLDDVSQQGFIRKKGAARKRKIGAV